MPKIPPPKTKCIWMVSVVCSYDPRHFCLFTQLYIRLVFPCAGSLLEGGGQILRNAVSLSAILNIPVRIDRIRAKRTRPGLRPQHLTGLQLAARLCGGTLEGGELGSSCVTFRPGKRGCQKEREFSGDTGTAGSCMLLAQVALPCLLFMPPCREVSPDTPWFTLHLRGGTDAPMAPPIGYYQHVLVPVLRRQLGIRVEVRLVRRGFYPKGQGLVEVAVAPLPLGQSLPPVRLVDRGTLERIRMIAFTAGRVKPSVGSRMAEAAKSVLTKRMKARGDEQGEAQWTSVCVDCEVYHEPEEHAVGDGCGIILIAETARGCVFGASGIGERGVSAEVIGERTGSEMADVLLDSQATVDDWLADQLIIFMALAKGESTFYCREPTLHTHTAIAVAEKLTGARFEVAPPGPSAPATWTIKCLGAGVLAGQGLPTL